MGPFTTLRFSGWEKTMRLNVDSIVHACQAVGPHMLERGTGSIINVASVASLVGTPELAPYGASKAAVLSLHPHARRRVGRRRGPGQRALPGLDAHRSERGSLERRADQHGDDGARPAGPLGRRRGDGRPSGVPRVRRVVVPDGSGARGRRRTNRRLAATSDDGRRLKRGRRGLPRSSSSSYEESTVFGGLVRRLRPWACPSPRSRSPAPGRSAGPRACA